MRQLLPFSSKSVTPAEMYGGNRNRVETSQLASRPTIGLCMVMSIDGSTVVDGRSTELSSPTDLAVLVALRRAADTIVIGAGTLRQEMYEPPSKPGLRVGVVTRTGNLDLKANLFRSGRGFLIMPEDVSLPEGSAETETMRAGVGSVDLNLAMTKLPGSFVQLEGGANLNAAMFAANLVDEINLTISPLVTGSDSPRLTSGAPAMLRQYEIAHLLEDDGFMFIKYVRRTPPNPN